MESNEERSVRPTSDDALASLEAVQGVQADLAERLVTPWWYHIGLGLIEAAIVSSVTLPLWLEGPIIAVAMVCLGLLVSAYKSVTGLGVSHQYLALARQWFIALTVVILTAFVVVLLVDEPTVTALAAVVVFVATVVLGRRFDSTVRDRLRHGARTR
jgi:hypothetical protein